MTDSERSTAPPRLGAEVLSGVRRAVLLSTHADDETFDDAGLVAMLTASGARVDAITATFGEPEQLAAALRGLLEGADLLIAPWRHGSDIDHTTWGSVPAQVAGEMGIRLLEYPAGRWHGATSADEWPPGAVRVDLPARTEVFVLTEPGHRATAEMENLHAANPDPWGAEDRWYEERKRAILLASLPRRRFRRALEVGCSTGRLSLDLAQRSDELIARDVSTTALAAASRRLAGTGADVAWANLPRDWPEGHVDLVVLSETGYFFSPGALEDFLDRLQGSLTEDGALVACHWMYPIKGWELDGIDVHRRLSAADFLVPLVQHREEDFWLDVLVRPPAVSIAHAEGLV